MNKRATIISAACLFALFHGQVVESVFAEGSSPFNMMNPSRWFGGANRDYDDYYDYGYGPYGRYGPYSEPGYGMPYGPPVPPVHGVPHDYPPPGYGGYGYARPPAPQGYAPAQIPPPVPAMPQQTEDASTSRIRELEERIRQLEASRQISPQPVMPSWQGTNSSVQTQPPSVPSTWQGGVDMPGPDAPPAPSSWHGNQEYTQPATQAPMPPPWQRSTSSEPHSASEPSMVPSWQGTGTGTGSAPQMPVTPAPELQSDFDDQQLRFRPY